MIAVPYHLGRRDVEVGRGPTRILEAAGRLATIVETEAGLAAVNRELARAVAAAHRPLILAGNCNSCIGTLAGLGEAGVVWFDAHGDFNTPETSPSGLLEGMSLAIACGHCRQDLRRAAGQAHAVDEANVILACTRSLDAGEGARLKRSRVLLTGVDQLPARLEALARRVPRVYLHLDLDVLDPQESPGVNFSEPGGLKPDEFFAAIREVGERTPLAAATIANFNPDRDREDRTLEIALRVVDILGEVLS